MLVTRNAFFLLAGLPEISGVITCKIYFNLFCTKVATKKMIGSYEMIVAGLYKVPNTLSPELNLICYLLALLAHHFLHVSRIRVKSLTLRLLMPYIYRRCGKHLQKKYLVVTYLSPRSLMEF
jgi:hypothetical protein